MLIACAVVADVADRAQIQRPRAGNRVAHPALAGVRRVQHGAALPAGPHHARRHHAQSAQLDVDRAHLRDPLRVRDAWCNRDRESESHHEIGETYG